MTQKTRFVVDAGIKGLFDNVDHECSIKFLEHDIKEKNFIRYIKRFLKAGIMEQGKYIESDKGTAQGGQISPILANVYLHYVLDLWFEKEVKKKFNRDKTFNKRSQKRIAWDKFNNFLEYKPTAKPKIYFTL